MFYWLIELSDKFSAFNVFRYITFRTGGAIVTALIFVFLFGGPIIDLLRLKQGKGQPIRADGPKSHLVTKKGTPTMGGLMILLAATIAFLASTHFTLQGLTVLFTTLACGAIGFLDDFIKLTHRRSLGLAGRWKMLLLVLIGLLLVAAGTLIRAGLRVRKSDALARFAR